jgi:tRNA dimethylallyltransferase
LDAVEKIPLLVVAGPTASGKTALAVALAKQLGGEVVSADSMQIYQGMEIATAKPTPAELAAVPHHLIGVANPAAPFSVAHYAPLAHAAIRDIHARGRRAILCGGTGLYLQAVTEYLAFAPEPVDGSLRAALQQRDSAWLHQQLLQLDPEAARRLPPADRKRVIRALELYYATGRTISQQNTLSRRQASPYESHMLFLNARNRQALYERIDRRVDAMMAQGLLEEAAAWRATATATAAQAIGYKELEPYFQGTLSLAQATDNVKRQTRRYAKRQLTWFRRMALEWNARQPGSCEEMWIDEVSI